MLEQLIGCRLEAVRLSKMAWSLEFEGTGSSPPRFNISTSADVSCVDSAKSARPTYEFIQDILEDDLVYARYSSENRTVTLCFRRGAQLEFSNREYVGRDNAAIITNLTNGEWDLLS